MGNSTISMAMFNSYVKLPEGITSSKNVSIFSVATSDLPPGNPLCPSSCAASANPRGRGCRRSDPQFKSGIPTDSTYRNSMDWFKGKSTGNHGFYHEI